MTTRTELKERSTRRKKIGTLIKRLLVTVSISAFIWLTVDSFNKASAIVISNTFYECQPKGCDYSFTVKNLSDAPVKGFGRLTVFKTSNIPGLNSDEVLSTERIEFILSASEKKTIKGFYVTRIEADKMTISVGEISNSL